MIELFGTIFGIAADFLSGIFAAIINFFITIYFLVVGGLWILIMQLFGLV